MDRETRAFAESHFRRLRGRPAGGAGATPGRVDFIESPDSFSYADFFKGYLLPNVPCVFSSSFTEGWGSRRRWVTPGGKPAFEHLLRNYGDVVVPVANCGVQEYNSNPKEHMLLRDYISYWEDYIQGGYSSPRGCLYLKDWHLCRAGHAASGGNPCVLAARTILAGCTPSDWPHLACALPVSCAAVPAQGRSDAPRLPQALHHPALLTHVLGRLPSKAVPDLCSISITDQRLACPVQGRLLWFDHTLLPPWELQRRPSGTCLTLVGSHTPSALFPCSEGVLGCCVRSPTQQCAGHKQRPTYSHPNHLVQGTEDASAEDVFTLPVYFSSDWLNEYWDALDVDDYRFIYMGPAGTWSPFHADIFRSFSWSVNICGRKKWFFFPPGQEEALRDCHGALPYDVTSPALLDSRLYPMRKHCSPPLELTQEAGEMVFVPSGWHHQVHNLQELRAVQREVSQWRDTMPDWDRHCQVIMRSCSGINFEEFYHFLKIIAERRLLLLAKEMGPGDMEGSAGSGLGPQQAAFDVSRIAEVLASVVAHPDFQRVDASVFSLQPGELLQQLEEVVAATASL
ncbi:2-oxoglutarate and iron-dependent oxygenase JMJD4 isoform X4 [Halichoerus grypus]